MGSYIERIMPGKGDPRYRTLMIDGSEESEQAVEYLESLGWAFTIEDYTGSSYERKLPALKALLGGLIIGLENIRDCDREEELIFKASYI